MSLPTHTQVLIVGAGPNGMACAIFLAHFGLQVTIVDASSTNSYGSRAAVVHARTLEMLDTIGLAKPLIEAGIQAKGGTVHGGSEKLIEIDMTQLRDETKFPLALFIPQDEVEEIFRDRLAAEGVEILRNRTVVNMKEDPTAAGIEVIFEDGSVVLTRYVVGADGSRSTIRRLAGIEFNDPETAVPYDSIKDPSSTFQIVLADVYLEEPLPLLLPRDALSLYFNNFLLFIPLRSKEPDAKQVSLWRIGFVIPAGSPNSPRHPDLHYIQQAIESRKPWPSKVTVASLVTASRYRIRSAVAATFFKKIGTGNILLVGDAAHVHSPAGGQGMNLGLCDAVSLGRAISSHIGASSNGDSEEKSDFLLHDYASSRKKTAIKVIGITKGINACAYSANGWQKYFQNKLLWIGGRFPFVRRALAWRMSGLIHRDA